MKEKSYINNVGEEKFNYELEIGDEFVWKQISSRDGKFGKMYTCLTEDGKYIRLTGGQHAFFNNFDPVVGTKIRCESYTNSFGTFVGLTYANKDDFKKVAGVADNNPNHKPSTLPVINKPNESKFELTSDEESCFNQLIGAECYAPYKKYAKENVAGFKEAIEQIGTDVGVNINFISDRLDKAYQLFLSKL